MNGLDDGASRNGGHFGFGVNDEVRVNLSSTHLLQAGLPETRLAWWHMIVRI